MSATKPSQTKPLPFSDKEITELCSQFPTPFHLYDEALIRNQCKRLKDTFCPTCPTYTNYFAVKATPTPAIMQIMKEEGFGADCSSMAELILSERCGFKGEEIIFTSNNTPYDEFRKARELGAIINFDDLSHIECAKHALEGHGGLPELVCFRYNPGPTRTGNVIIGNPKEAKYGVTRTQLLDGYLRCKELGAKRFGLHTMVISNCLDREELKETAVMVFELVQYLHENGITVEWVNLGGGIGVAYRPEEGQIDLEWVSKELQVVYDKMITAQGLPSIRIVTECGRFVTGPAGVLVTRVLHEKRIFKNYVGVDACMANLMRPGMYGAYHHITLVEDPAGGDAEKQAANHCDAEKLGMLRKFRDVAVNSSGDKTEDRTKPLSWKNSEEMAASGFTDLEKSMAFDIVGGLCENNDKFAIDRQIYDRNDELKKPKIGDLLIIHDAGAHGHSMGFNYNGKPRSAEILMSRTEGETTAEDSDGSSAAGNITTKMIRRGETYDDLFKTIEGF